MTNDPAAQPESRVGTEGGGGCNPRTMPTDSTRASAPEPLPHPTHQKTLWAWTLATFFGAGLGKPGPGTWGSVAAFLCWAAEGFLRHPSAHVTLVGLLVWIAFAIALGIPSATIVAHESARKDPQIVVIDEVAGQWIALLFCPVDWKHGLVCLLLFRLFDITKPFPARQLENLPGGWGIVFDDVAAGLYALGVASVLRIWI